MVKTQRESESSKKSVPLKNHKLDLQKYAVKKIKKLTAKDMCTKIFSKEATVYKYFTKYQWVVSMFPSRNGSKKDAFHCNFQCKK